MRITTLAVLLSSAVLLQACLATAVAGAAVGATGAVIKTTVKAGTAVGKAVIP